MNPNKLSSYNSSDKNAISSVKCNLKGLLFVLILFSVITSCRAPHNENNTWSFKVTDRIQSHPVVDKNVVYFGCNDSNFYAVDAVSGKELWRIKTRNSIRSQAVVKDSLILFSSGNNLFAVNKSSGKEIWAYRSNDTTDSGIIDPWDYHTGSPVIDKSTVYIGFGNGSLIGFDQNTGNEIFRYCTLDSSAIRSTPVISNGVIYFGDWNGRIYAVDINNKDTLWVHLTYDTQPYPTFGQINSKLELHDSILVFGARNPELQAINIHTGKVIWTHIEKTGGWISGDPKVSGDTMYIGGSDNHKFMALNVTTGEIFWEYTFLFNNFSRPVIYGDNIFFTTGDAYSFAEKNVGYGYLYALSKNDGSLINMDYFPGNLFNTPVLNQDNLLIGGDDSNLHSIDLDEFLNPKINLPENGLGPIDQLMISIDSVTNDISITFDMKYSGPVSVRILDFDGQLIKTLIEDNLEKGNIILRWDGMDSNKREVQDGYYFAEVKSAIFVKNIIIQYKMPDK